MPHHDIVVVGASAGGVPVLRTLIAGLPRDLRASVFVVLHTNPGFPSALSEILASAGKIRVSEAVDGEEFEQGHVYTARPNWHLVLEKGRTVLVDGPRENRSRPAVDALFRSAAVNYAHRVIGVVLTGLLDDGSAGLWAVKRAGGLAVVQSDAEYPCMPRNASLHIQVDYRAPIAQMSDLLVRLVAAPSAPSQTLNWNERRDPALTFVCPDCNGPMERVLIAEDEPIVRFRCQVGHAYSLATLLANHAEAREGAMWAAIRSLEDEAKLIDTAIAQGVSPWGAEAQIERAARCRDQARQIRHMLQPIKIEADSGHLRTQEQPLHQEVR